MLTQCPHCQTIFRITQDILGVADGQVRCGRCGASFDGISGFVDRHQLLTARRSGAPSLGKSAPASPKPAEPLPMPISEPAKSDAAELAPRGTEPPKTEPDSKASEPSTPKPIAADSPVPPAAPTPQSAASITSATATPPVEPAAETSTTDDVDSLLHRPKKPTSSAWKFIVPPLVVLLGIQFVHYFRQDIASNPRFGPPLIALYTNLGLYLTPHWRLRDYEVRQWGVLANPETPGTLKVRASITNRAPFAQPYPLLRLVLEDRFGQQVQAREFEPREYAAEKLGSNTQLLPNERIDASLTIVDPGTQAEGFRFDVCLRQPKGVFCADDEPAP